MTGIMLWSRHDLPGQIAFERNECASAKHPKAVKLVMWAAHHIPVVERHVPLAVHIPPPALRP
jgi:acyl-homoserine lactone acylase PvdQ